MTDAVEALRFYASTYDNHELGSEINSIQQLVRTVGLLEIRDAKRETPKETTD
jgi:uncharacterized protein YbcC (UPF0753/DUF2309 family)